MKPFSPAGNGKRPTLKDIAYMTGLGVTTVSRALNDASDIGEATKERVRLVANQIGYRPNRAGVRLRTGKTNVISVILNTEEEAMGMSAPMINGISRALGETSYHLVVTPYNLGQDPLDPVRYVVETGSADGIIFSRTEPNDARVQYLTDRGFPFASHGRTTMGIEHAYYDFDNFKYAQQAVENLAAAGREKISLLGPPDDLTFSKQMSQGFNTTLQQNDLLEIPIRNVTIDSPFSEIQDEMDRILRSKHRPDGIVCGSATAAIAVTMASENLGMTIGKDIDIVAKESFELLQRIRPKLIVIREDFPTAGFELGKMIVALIDGDGPEQHQMLQVP